MRTLGCCRLVLSYYLCGAAFACSTSGTPVEMIDVGSGLGGEGSTAGSGAVGSKETTGGSGAVKSSGAVGGNSHLTGSVDVSGNTTPTDVTCAQNQVPIQVLPPDIMIVMDRSLSMTDDEDGQPCADSDKVGDGNCGTASKWYQTVEAIKSVVGATQTRVNWGMFWLGDEPARCGAGTTPVVPITRRESLAPIQQALEGNAFEGDLGTPTAKVIENTIAYMKTLDSENPKYLLVATDGEPNCAGGKLNSVDTTGATSAVAAAAAANMPTFVVGIATTSLQTATSVLNSMAVAGGRAQTGTDTQYYAVTDTATLEATLTRIVELASSCTISLENVPTGEWTMAISATDASEQDVLVPESDTDGWIYTDASSHESITLVGTACDRLKDGSYSNLQFVYTCPGRDIVL